MICSKGFDFSKSVESVPVLVLIICVLGNFYLDNSIKYKCWNLCRFLPKSMPFVSSLYLNEFTWTSSMVLTRPMKWASYCLISDFNGKASIDFTIKYHVSYTTLECTIY